MQPTDQEIADRLRAILSSEEFHPGVGDRISEWINRILRALTGWGGRLGRLEGWLVATACCAVLVALALYAWRQYLNVGGPSLSRAASDALSLDAALSPEALLLRARSLADGGALRDAARALQHALLVRACRERRLAWQPARSDWEWLEALKPSRDVIDLTKATQRLAFGPQPDRAAFDSCERRVRALLGGPAPSGREAA